MRQGLLWLLVGTCAVGAVVLLLATNGRSGRRSVLDPTTAEPPAPETPQQRLQREASALPRSVPTDPNAPGYDPEKLVRVAGLDLIFEAEPRRESWAHAVERALTPALDAHSRALVPELGGVTLQCRSTMCAVRWTFARPPSAETEARWREIVRQLFPGSGRFVDNARLVHWSAPEWKGDIREADIFVTAARAHLESAAEFLKSSDGERELAKVLAHRKR
jgi:hypothetical protein